MAKSRRLPKQEGALGDRVDGTHNVHRIEAPETSFEGVFGQEIEQAVATGYRSRQAHIATSVDPRFWDPDTLPPGPRDEGFAVAALVKIYADD